MKKTKSNGTGYSWGDSIWAQEENFLQRGQSAFGIISPGKRWSPQHWTLLMFSWTRTGPSYLEWALPTKIGPDDP